ncbi:peptidoglycan-binding domain-containing protein [Salipiger sp.]|uniref:peptidoglycan-binding domain-containing protein n=1 Tax=Salipiger sp. TaxID=2078585 RepID=UPI003A97495E
MDRDTIRRIQTRLAELGHYHDEIDGVRGDNTHAAVRLALTALATGVPADWPDWSEKRQTIGFYQHFCLSKGIDAGPIDGWWGPQTDHADWALAQLLETGSVPAWRDIAPSADNPNGWPAESGVTAFYGPHGAADWSRPPPKLVKVASPYTFKLAWNKSERRSFLWAHERTAASLGRILAEIMRHYGGDAIARLGLDIFSGDYHPRLKRGSATQWSMHAWGIAYDFDDENNKLPWGADRARFAKPDYLPFWSIWEAEGWVSLGRSRNRDWMHVQAARLN